MRVLESINGVLRQLMATDPNMILLGEDILDPYGGAFKVTKGLSTEFSDRIWTTPISENAIVGIATGLAMQGKPAIVELMFGDFIALAADQLINHAAKFQWMYHDQVEVPLIVRTPMGGRRGYGPTHSQSLEKHFCGVPGLTVLAVHEFADPAALYLRAYRSRTPHLIIENKGMYARPLFSTSELAPHTDPDLVILTYGGSVGLAVEAAKRLLQEEDVAVNVIAVSQLYPFPAEEIRASVGRAMKVVVVEEGSSGWGFSAECALALVGGVQRFTGLCGPSHPIPSARDLEEAVLPSTDDIEAACLALFMED